MKRLLIKSKGKMWPTVIWQGTKLVVYYVGEGDEEVEVRETHGIDFEEFFLHLDKGGSVFVTLKPQNGNIVDSNSRNVVDLLRELPQQGGV